MLLGDAVCALNPVFGQGMTVSALGAKFLGECIARAKASPEGLPLEVARPFQKKLAGLIGLCWTLTTTMDLAHPRAEGKRPFGLKFLQWSFQNMIDLTSQHAASCRTFYEALHLRKGIMGLLQPGFLGALLVYNLKSFFVPRHKRANLDQMPARPGPRPSPGLERVDAAA
ncbi:NAD(P)/FAD-dependent oxidoreductase [Cystobacter fuscus]